MTDVWDERASSARDRRDRLASFGAHARGLLVSTEHGLFVVDPEDNGVSASLLHHGIYGEGELAFAASLITPRSQVLVVGAHIGALAVPLAQRCARLVAIEANPRTFELLQANVRLNGADNIVVHNVAVGDEDGRTVEFMLNRENSGGSKLMPTHSVSGYTYDSPEVIQVMTSRIDTILPDQSFDLVIMDIEGSEIFALRGMPHILDSCRSIAVEFRPHHIADVANAGIDQFLDAIQPYFSWMYVPGRSSLLAKPHIAEALRTAYAAGECHDAIYLFKEQPGVALS